MIAQVRLLAFVLVLSLAACAHQAEEFAAPAGEEPRPDGVIRVGPGLNLRLPSVHEFGRTLEADQLVTVSFGEQSFVFQAHIRAAPTEFQMVNMDMMGRRLVTITWTDTGIKYDTDPFLSAQLHPENILADMVILYWPPAVVQRCLAASGGILEATKTRRIVKTMSANPEDTPILIAEYDAQSGEDIWTETVHYRNVAWGYDFRIQSRLADPP